jgi:hypothetical protein
VADIIKTYRQTVPAMRFIGKKYSDDDRVNGGFAKQWVEWFSNGWFSMLQSGFDVTALYEDGDATIGLMRWKEGEPFEYWIGVFCPPETHVPDGFSHIDFPASDLGVAWVYGKEGDVFGQEERCAERCMMDGFEIVTDEQGAYWFFERYVCPRFTTPDEQGSIILDICHYIAKK